MEVVCITGMHRSGTSLVSRIVNLLGVDLGRHDSLLPPSEDNPGGFWENREVKRINDRVLRTLGGNWHEPPALPEDWQSDPVFDPVRKDAASVLAGESSASELFGWKDPRTSLTLPFWLTVTRVRGNIVCLRQPRAVAVSLAQRNGFATEKSAGLWILYTLNAWLSHPHRLLVTYDRVISQVEESTTQMARYLTLSDPDTDTLRQVRDVITPSSERGPLGLEPASGPLMELAENLMRMLTATDEAAARPAMEGMARLTRARRLTEELFVRDPQEASARAIVREQVGATEASMRDLQRMVAAAVERTEVERRHIARTEMSRLRREERKARTERDEHAAELGTAATERDQRASELATVVTERDELRAERDELRAEQQRLWAERQAAQQEVAQVRGELDKLRKESESARRRADRDRAVAQRDLERLRGRRSVKLATRIARPAKPIFRLVRRTRSSKRNELAQSSAEGGDRPGKDRKRTRFAAEEPKSGGSSSSPASQRLDRHHDWAETADRLNTVDRISVIIPVYNAPQALRRCVDALIRNTSRQAELLLVDDASTDPTTATILREVRGMVGVKVLCNEKNRGFTATVNRGLQETSADVVILNSDTQVPPRWLENLTACAYHDKAVGTVTPLSNNAGAFSAPSLGQDNPFPSWLTFDDLGRRVTRTSRRLYPRTPTGNGFCLYIKRRLLDQIGYLDSTNFPRGYGEENDFCMRALSVGWANVVDDATYVAHELAASFGADDRTDLMHQGRRTVDRMHPTYTKRVRAFIHSEEMALAREAVGRAMGQRDTETPLRILYVVHSGRGGTPSTNVDLMESLQPDVECLVLESDTKMLRLRKASGRELIEIDREELDPPLRFGELSRQDYRTFVASVLVEYGIELVHVRHLVKHTLDIPDLSRCFDIPVIVSLHDYYLACPTVHLLDENDKFCGGKCTDGPGPCRIPMEWIAQDVPTLKHDWVYEWRSKVFPLLSQADALVTTTESAKAPYVNAYPELGGKRWEIIEHGRDVEQQWGLHSDPVPGGIIRLLLPGNLDIHKGSQFIRELKKCDQANRLELHFLGQISEELQGLGEYHGAYKRDEFIEKLKNIRPVFVGLFSIWAETYMHTLTEAWGAGVPVVATDIGALGERIRSHGGGWLVDPADPGAAYDRLLRIADDPASYRSGQREASVRAARSTRSMGRAYLDLYRSVLRRRQSTFAWGACGLWGEREMEARVLVVGEGGRHPGSAHVRALRRFSHPDVRRHVNARLGTVDEVLDNLDGCDVVYVERTAVRADRVSELVERAHATDTPIVLDLDDNLLDASALEAAGRTEWLDVVDSIRLLAARAEVVIVSTDALARVAIEYAHRVKVIPNMLDERLWFLPAEGVTRSARSRREGIQLFYMGTATHEHDLALFRPVMDQIRSQLDKRAALNVIGGEPERPDEWYRRVNIPPGVSAYPSFVRWLSSMASNWDIAIAPLADSEFNRYKSDLKFLEYSAMGLPGVYSNSTAYSGTIRDGETGILVDQNPKSWVEAVRTLAGDGQYRERIAHESYKYVVDSRTLRTEAGEFVDVLADAISEAGKNI